MKKPYIKRKLEDTISKYLEKREILAIVGPRQAGKTTLLKKVQSELKNSVFLSFEDREDLELFERDVKSFAKKYFDRQYVFIDEFQYSKHGGKRLKYLYDTYPDVKIVISGSSAIDLTVQAIKFLVGRVFVFNLYQLDFEEYLLFKSKEGLASYGKYKKSFDIQKDRLDFPQIKDSESKELKKILDDFILWGGYPRVALAQSDDERKTVLKNIYNTYFLRDIRDVLGLTDDFRLSKLVKLLAVQIGQLVSYNELGSSAGYDYLTLKKYLNVLEKTFICQPIRPYFVNKRKEITKNPKIYFFDTGLRNHIVGNFSSLNERDDKGFLLENYIFNQLVKKDMTVNFWRTKQKDEVDFVVETGGRKIPLESKSVFQKAQMPKGIGMFVSENNSELAVILNETSSGRMMENKTKVYILPHWII
ncbi:MAG TPA: ATP-binding protein [Candidatus Saccharimonadales bacterium]|nr:ATP-binding protein [Candidatus Saccharimonadales bacterium]